MRAARGPARTASPAPPGASPGADLTRLLAGIARTAARLCEATDALIHLVEGDGLRFVAHHGPIAIAGAIGGTRPAFDRSPGGDALRTRRPVHVRDVRAVAAARYPDIVAVNRAVGARTVLAMPMLQGAEAVGLITIRRMRVNPFTPRQIALLRTFADQAALAVANARLAETLAARNAELTQALEQQTATGDILGVISASPTDVQPVFDAIARHAVALCDGESSFVVRYDGELMRVAAHHNFTPGRMDVALQRFPRPLDNSSPMGMAIAERRVVYIGDLQASAQFARTSAYAAGLGSLIAVPLLHEGRGVGAISVERVAPGGFSERQVALLRTFADQAVIAVGNARLFGELQASNAGLRESLAEQTATADILQLISNGPSAIQPVFDAIARHAVALCGGASALVCQYDGELMRLVSDHDVLPANRDLATSFFPRCADDTSAMGIAILERRIVHVPDLQAEVQFARTSAYRAGRGGLVAVPLLHDGRAIGAIGVARDSAGGFSDRQLSLLRTFADQAVIAIQNVRLFTDLEARNRALGEALEQQTATSRVLEVISGSPTDIRPVMEALVQSAVTLCRAQNAQIFRVEGDRMRLMSRYGPIPASLEIGQARSISHGSVSGRAIVERRVVEVPDLLAVEDEYPDIAIGIRRQGIRTTVALPLLREGVPIGVMSVYRTDVRPYTEGEVALLKTFADQAVIAIENATLFEQLQARNAELTEALDRQTATAEILRVISGSRRELQPVFDTIIQSAVRVCGALSGGVFRLAAGLVRWEAYAGATTPEWEALAESNPGRRAGRPPRRETLPGWVLLEGEALHVPDIASDDRFPMTQELARRGGYRSALGVPMFRDGAVIGTILLNKAEPFTPAQISLLETFAAQAVIAIENARLLTELEARNADLTDALEQQTATAGILNVISRSPTDVQPVLDAIAVSGARVCHAVDCIVHVVRDDQLVVAAYFCSDDFVPLPEPFPITRGSVSGRAALERDTVHVEDLAAADPVEYPIGRARQSRSNRRTSLAVPLVRDGVVIGVLLTRRTRVQPFTDKQIALLQTFADQAVIAIENVRLFRELEARNTDLTESLDRQTATAEILRAISQAQTDVQPVFEAIADSALRLLHGWSAIVFRYDGEFLALAAARGGLPGSSEAIMEWLQHPHRPDASMMPGRTVLTRTMQQTVDIETDEVWGPALRDSARERGWRSTIHVPMLRVGEAVGTIGVTRAEPGAFSSDEIALLQTFADQAVIAIENARLLGELQARNAELTESLDQQTATAEILRVISRSPRISSPSSTRSRRAPTGSATRCTRGCSASKGAWFTSSLTTRGPKRRSRCSARTTRWKRRARR